eukprot:CAMPEP_0168405592 /NCGR_PEP_ID=MMETSP0228-20121227/25219_1 /TAXON_ID=133427 /ORGANISM="Protoceratium reticulatum, Strain CCCM 535 (=CCMP 1889)" /LENGTH=87 /DNA_ID=CAMNT_0008419221 /DNA_START=175 /DNA_END=438 /DNA_ORIENTATION=+
MVLPRSLLRVLGHGARLSVADALAADASKVQDALDGDRKGRQCHRGCPPLLSQRLKANATMLKDIPTRELRVEHAREGGLQREAFRQ